jgi:hypothetical protein
MLAVCVGSVVTNLITGKTNDDFQGFTSQVSFNSVSGVHYSIMVAGYNGASGLINLNIMPATSGGCVFSFVPDSKAFSYTATNGTIAVTATTGCVWSATAFDSWIHITSGNTGSGNGTVSYSVDVNTTPVSRFGTIGLAGSVFAVNQSGAPGCIYSLSPTTFNTVASPITNSISMTATTGCAWTATPNASWITISSGTNGTGNGTITYVLATNILSNSRSGTITAAGQTHTVTQAGNVPCTFSISPSTAPFAASGGTSNIVVSTLSGCTWTASSPVSWVTFSTTNGTGNGSVTYTVATNVVTLPRSTILTVAQNPFTVTQSSAACSYALTSSSFSAPAIASSSTVGVTTTTGCGWTAVSNDSFITITAGTSGSGSGTVSFTVAANINTTTRSGTMTIGGQTFTVSQAAAACIYSISSTSAHFSSASQPGIITVTAGTGCAWTAVANDVFITIDSGTPGSGNGSVGYTVSANSSTNSRIGTITVATKTYTVTQDGTTPCAYSILPTSCACAATSGNASIAVTANTNCVWSVTSSDPSWLTFSPPSGSGNGTVVYTITSNPSSIPRTATLTIADKVFTVNQSGIACTFTVSPTSASFTYVGGIGTATVTAAAGCAWSSISDSTWLVITAGASGTGNGSVSYTVSSTTATTNRTGRLTIAGKVLNVTQTGAPCTTSISPTSATISDIGGGGIISITKSDQSCTWTAITNQTWISVSPSSGTGNGSITFSVLPTNQQITRNGTITISGQVFSITQTGDTTIPVVTITAPTASATISNVFTLTATATDDVAVSRVDFYRDAATFLGSVVASPYALPFNTTNVANGSYTFYMRGFDSANNQGSSATNTVTISNSAPVTSNTWVYGYGGTGTDIGSVIAMDGSDNIYVAGVFTGSASFGGSTLTNAGGTDLFLAKYSSAGIHQWSVRYGNTGNETVQAMTLDSTGKIIIAAHFSGLANFGGTNFVTTPSGVAIAKYSPTDGSHIWSEGYYGTSSVLSAGGITTDAADNVLTTGYFQGTINLGTTNMTNADGTDMFVAKYSTLGAPIWSITYPRNAADDIAQDIVCDSNNNVFVTGYTLGYIDFGGGYIISDTGSDVFVLKLNSSAAFQWARGYGGPRAQRAFSMVIDYSEDPTNGRLIIAGDFYQAANIGGITMTAPALSAFLMKLNTTTGDPFWARRTGGNLVSKTSNILALGPSGTFRLTGSVDNSTKDFITATITPTGSGGGSDIFISSYNPAGALNWVQGYGSINSDIGNAIAVDSTGYATATGYFVGTASFGGIQLISQGSQDVFLIRVAP